MPAGRVRDVSGLERLPIEGSADGRRVARVVNSIRDGKLDCVGTLRLPAVAEEVSIADPRVSPSSCVVVMQPWWISAIRVNGGTLTVTAVEGEAGRELRYAVIG